MRIERLHIEAFGPLHDLLLEFAPGLNVLLGPNEAGKSTIHAFVRAMLHGPGRKDPLPPPLAGGNHGGSLTLVEETRVVRIERTFSGKRRLRIVDAAGAELGEAALRSLLGNVDAGLYRSVFAFDLDDLKDLGFESEEIERRLFDAGLVGAGQSLSALRKELEGIREALLRKRSGPIRERAKEIDELRRELEARIRQSRGHAELIREEEELAERLRAAQEERARLRAEERRWDLLLSLWPDEVKRQRLVERSQVLSPAGESAAALAERLSRVRRLDERIATLQENLEHLLAERETTVREKEGTRVDERFLGLRSDLASLLRDVSLQEESVARIAALERSIREREEQAARLASSLGPGWTVKRALGVERGLDRRDQLEGIARRLAEAESDLRGAEDREQRCREALGRCAREVELAAAALRDLGEVPSAEVLERKAGALAEVRTALLLRGTPGFRTISLALAGLAAGAAILCAFLGDWTAAAVAVGSAAAFLALGLRIRPGGRAREVEAARALLGLPASAGPADVEAAAAELERARSARQRWEELARRLEDARGREAIEFAEYEGARARVEEARRRVETLREEWAVRTADLGESLGPEAAKERLGRLDQIAALCESASRLQAERDDARRRLATWNARARDLLDAAGLPVSGADFGALRAGLAVLEQRVGEEARRADRLAQLEQRLQQIERQLDRDRAAVEAARAERRRCLEEAGAAEVDDLLECLERQREREEIERALAQIEASFVERLGRGEEAERIREALASGRREEWQAEVERCRERLEALDARVEVLQAELARIRQRRADLEASTAVLELSERLRQKEAEWGAMIQRYRKAALFERLLDAALEELHEARQPAVLRSASAFFQRITGGRYERIRQMREEKHVEVVLPHGGAIAASSLSRGTREQLYLCLRLGLADAFAEQGARLPLLMDDVLVNFDPVRARATAEVLGEAATRHQILLFTCHPSTAELLEEVAGAVRLEIGGRADARLGSGAGENRSRFAGADR